jgi:Uma2 family endonuclease
VVKADFSPYQSGGKMEERPACREEPAMTTRSRATIDDLYGVPDNAKAELVNGELVFMSPTGAGPGYAGDEIFASLREFARRTGLGKAVGDNKGFHVDLPRRESFSPDAAFYVGPNPGMRFYEGAPVFAVEVRSEGDYGPTAEREMAEKRADYFESGTLVVWDVDLLAEDVVKVYRSSEPHHPTVYRRGQIAEAEPAVPGWTMRVDELFAAS